jgi:hypothetical protein
MASVMLQILLHALTSSSEAHQAGRLHVSCLLGPQAESCVEGIRQA